MVSELLVVEASLNHSAAISSHTQSIRIEDLVQELASGCLLLPNVEGLTNPGETRIGQELTLGADPHLLRVSIENTL